MLKKGETAPDFTTESTQGRVSLSELGSPIVLYFFSKSGSTVCTREACEFRESMEDFNELDATVIGVSTNDSLEELEDFREEYGLDFPLVSDTSGEMSELYDISGLFDLYDKRVTYVIDEGVIVERVSSMLRAKKHVEESLNTVRSIKITA